MNRNIEHKVVTFEIESLDAEGRTFEGYASIFDIEDLGGDVVHRGAFTKTLAERGNKVRLLWQHNPDEPLGKIMLLREDEKGLFVRAAISDTARGRDALALLKDGAIEAMSIGYDAVDFDFDQNEEGEPRRNLRAVRLWEISLVSFPMQEMAEVTALKQKDTKSEPEHKAGRVLSKRNATRLMNALDTIRAVLDDAGLFEDDSEDEDDENSKQAAPIAPAQSRTSGNELDVTALLEEVRTKKQALVGGKEL